MVDIPCTKDVGASQQHTVRLSLLLLELKGLFQSNFQCTSRVGGRPGRDKSDVFLHKCEYLRAFKVGNQEIPFHIHQLLLADRERQLPTIDPAAGDKYDSLASDPRENFDRDIFHSHFSFYVCKGTVTQGLNS
jgi:hypothetical protein